MVGSIVPADFIFSYPFMKSPRRENLVGLTAFLVHAIIASAQPAMELQLSESTGRLQLQLGDDALDLGRLEFFSRQAGATGQVSMGTMAPTSSNKWRLSGAPELGDIRVVTGRLPEGGMSLTMQLEKINRTGLFRPVLAFADPEVLSLAESAKPQRADGKIMARVDLGFVIIAAKYDPTNVARAMVAMGDGNLIAWRQHSRVIDLPQWPPFEVELSIERVPLAQAREALARRLHNQSVETAARLKAWTTLMTAHSAREVNRTVTRLRDRLSALQQGIYEQLSESEQSEAGLYRTYELLRQENEKLAGAFAEIADGNQVALREAARERLVGMNYRAGLARDGNPGAAEYNDWALFRMGLVRLAVNPVWHDGMDRAGRVARIRHALNEVNDYGGKVVLSVHEEQAAEGPEDLTFTNEFIPALRSGFHEFGFNSSRLRQAKLQVFGDWMDATWDHPALWTYKIDNEPFWSTQEYPIFGYDEATVGCAPEVFAAALRQAYPDLADWRERIAGTLAEKVIPWRQWSEVGLSSHVTEGLTLVDYLRGRYRMLGELNRVWGTNYARWDEVFPPLPDVDPAREADDSGSPEFDIGAFNPGKHPQPRPPAGQENQWADWTRFWAHNINDELRGFVALGRSRGNAVPITTNALAGHMYTANDVTHSLFPWVTTDGLDALAIDFYRMGYLQGYLRTLAGAAQGRPIEIHETGGSDTAEDAWFTTAFAYAYGARGTLFWRRDHRLPPASALGIAEAIDAMADTELQQNSEPLSDGIVLVYPFDGMHVAGARRSPHVKVEAMQAALMWAKREQWQYTVVADQDLANAVSADRPRCVVIPSGAFLTAMMWSALEDYLASGGTAVVTEDLGRWNMLGEPRDMARREKLFKHPRVRVMAPEAWEQLLAVTGQVGDARLGLGGETPAVFEPVSAFVRLHAPALVRYVEDSGAIRRTHAALRITENATYAFVDPWTKNVWLESIRPLQAARDLATGEQLKLEPFGQGHRVAVSRAATIIRLEHVPERTIE